MSLEHPALRDCDKRHTVVLLVESIERGRKIEYHQHKLILIYAAMRHFADDLRERGFRVDHRVEAPSFAESFAEHVKEHAPARVRIAEQSEFGATDRLREIVEKHDVAFEVLPLVGFIASRAEFDACFGARARLTMENFYRTMRRKTGLLMEGEEPVGGRWNFDKENRKPPPSGLRAPLPRQFPPDAHTRAVIEMVGRHFAHHPGDVEGFALPVSRADALAALEDFIAHRLPNFGPYEDAIVLGESVLYHSMLSSAINIGLLHPLECARAAEKAYREKKAPLASVEGFIRQLIGWREFMRGIYDRFMPEYRTRNSLDADQPVPKFYWTGETDMACVREAVGTTLRLGWTHHIMRLMVLGNFGLLLGVVPRELNDWYWAMYIDAYDWVMVPNVIGMTLHADGGVVGTKPYAASARYIDSMSNACKGCRYSPKRAVEEDACPFNALYWDFLARHAERFGKNTRMALVMRSLHARPEPWLAEVRTRARALRRKIAKGERV